MARLTGSQIRERLLVAIEALCSHGHEEGFQPEELLRGDTLSFEDDFFPLVVHDQGWS